MDEGKLWSLIRNVLTQGGAIQLDRASMSSYEEYSARLDAAAAERVADFTKLADARIAELERNIERLDAQWREELRIYREADDARIAELEAEVSGLRVDAERWRKLRGMHWSKEDDFTVTRGRSVKLGFLAYSGEQLDAAIDAARANGGGE